MKNFIAAASTAVMFAASSFAAIAPVSAAPMHGPDRGQQQRFVMNWCQQHPRDNSCNDFNRHRHNWSDSQYRGWYSSHRGQGGFDATAAGIFGFAAGAIIAGAAASANASNNSSHIAACQSAYRSYQVRSDTYLGYDGVRHQCRL